MQTIFFFHNVGNVFQAINQVSTSDHIKVSRLSPGESVIKKVYIDFGDSKRASEWVIRTLNGNEITVIIEAPMGEQIEPIRMTEEQFINGILRLSGMNEHCGNLKGPLKPEQLYAVANCTNVTGSEVCFSYIK